MFSDTHCHLKHCAERGAETAALLAELAAQGCPFLLDIGTEADDLPLRYGAYSTAIPRAADDAPSPRGSTPPIPRAADDAPPAGVWQPPSFLSFSAGIWPSREAIDDGDAQCRVLEQHIRVFHADHPAARLVAIGECGIDRHHNAPDAKNDAGEHRLFEAQIELAASLCLPVIVHSRDAFDETYFCLKESNAARVIIHSFSYGIPQATAFLDRGYYLSLTGAVTYAKKNAAADVAALIRHIPRDRLLLETDAPYLAPVPHRGELNTPLLIPHTYRFVAAILGITDGELALLIQENARAVFLYAR